MPFGGVDRCFDPVLCACFGEDVGDVPGHGVYADEQLSGNLRVVSAHGNEGEHFSLSLSELMGKYSKYGDIDWPVMIIAGLLFGFSQK